jgi:hypothetical protein
MKKRVVTIFPCDCGECSRPGGWTMWWVRLPNGDRAGSARPFDDAIDLAVNEAIRLDCEVWT